MSKGLICCIFESKALGNASNHGISSRCKSVILTGENIPEIFNPTKEVPEVRLCGHVAYPIDKIPEGRTRYMFGGCFIYSEDSRFPFDHPIRLHDRTETWEEYKSLSI